MKRYILLPIVAIFFFSCKKTDDSESTVQLKGSRQLGIHVTISQQNDYASDFAKAQAAGMNAIPQSYYWNEIETPAGFNTAWLKVAGYYYPSKNVQIALTISPIKAFNKCVPEDLNEKPFDNPEFISRFCQLLDSIHKYIPVRAINSLIIGNEVDLYLDAHPQEYNAYKTFADSISSYSKKIWSKNLKTGVETSWGGLTGTNKELIKNLNKNMDLVVFSYYPLAGHFSMKLPDAVGKDLEAAFNLYPSRKLFMEECGYATSSSCNSSDEKQAEFISEIFKFWDMHSTDLEFVGFLWLNDLPDDVATSLVGLYGMNNNMDMLPFKEYLRTLGLCTYNGTEKAGYKRLLEETKKRSWGN